MTQLIPVNVPLFYQCRRIPVEWRADGGILTLARPPESSYIERKRRGPFAIEFDEFDPWEKRDEFFALKKDDPQALAQFLNTTGLFDQAKFNPSSQIPVAHVWVLRELLMRCLTEKSAPDWKAEFEVSIESENQTPRVVFITNTFMDALLLTVVTDDIRNAKIRKCARPDCGIPFAVSTGHEKKFHCWDCGHIESVRRQRRKAKMKRRKKGKHRSSKPKRRK
jgi:hypothetical protein